MTNWFKESLTKTVEAIKTVAPKKKIFFTKDELEDILLEADVEYALVEIILEQTYQEKIDREILRSKLLATLAWTTYKEPEYTLPFVELIVGVNGAGKTTTISKLAQRYKSDGKRVILGAGDTFRAAAIEQLTLWSQKLDIPIIASKQGHDSSAVAYDTIDSAKSKDFDNVIIDTAGRLHTQKNLANELKKIKQVCNKAHNGAPHRTILIIDGTQGNSAIVQAKAFKEMIGIDGVIITKLDGTPKGGSIFSIAYALEIPILYIGIGEQPEDLIPFDKYEFVDGLLDSLFIDEEITEETPKPEDVTSSIESKETKVIETIKEEVIVSENELSLNQFLKDEKLILVKKISNERVLVNYANTPVDTHIEYKDNKWHYAH